MHSEDVGDLRFLNFHPLVTCDFLTYDFFAASNGIHACWVPFVGSIGMKIQVSQGRCRTGTVRVVSGSILAVAGRAESIVLLRCPHSVLELLEKIRKNHSGEPCRSWSTMTAIMMIPPIMICV